MPEREGTSSLVLAKARNAAAVAKRSVLAVMAWPWSVRSWRVSAMA